MSSGPTSAIRLPKCGLNSDQSLFKGGTRKERVNPTLEVWHNIQLSTPNDIHQPAIPHLLGLQQSLRIVATRSEL